MKIFLSLCTVLLLLNACNRNTGSSEKGNDSTSKDNPYVKINLVASDTLYGPAFDYDMTQDLTTLLKDESKLDTTKYYAVAATITEVCQKRGCWFRTENGKGGSVFVKLMGSGDMEDELTIPMTHKGRKVIFFGMPAFEMVSVKSQQHFLEDAGKSKEEIDAIKEPKQELRFYATSVVVIHE